MTRWDTASRPEAEVVVGRVGEPDDHVVQLLANPSGSDERASEAHVEYYRLNFGDPSLA